MSRNSPNLFPPGNVRTTVNRQGGRCLLASGCAAILVTIIIILATTLGGDGAHPGRPSASRPHVPISDADIAQSISESLIRLNELLDPILIPRVSGTPGNRRVQNYITDFYSRLGDPWVLEKDVFRDRTPLDNGKDEREFTNIIAHYNRDAPRKLYIAAHYDSKYFKDLEFIGATDSAASVAIMLHISEILSKRWAQGKHKWLPSAPLGLSFLFFDGEEAFERWNLHDEPKDGCYGSRHLAKRWEKERVETSSGAERFRLDEMQLLFLLDLIGAPVEAHRGIDKDRGELLPSFFRDTDHIHEHLIAIEDRIPRMLTTVNSTVKYMARGGKRATGGVEDDFVPFRGL